MTDLKSRPAAGPPADSALPEAGGRGWLRWRALASLSYGSFRFFWLSNLLVAMGLMVQFIAQGWLVVQLTDSALLLGTVEGIFALSFAGGSLPMGIIADRTNRRNLLLAGNLVATANAALVGALAVADGIQVWHLMAVSLIGGVLMALRFPASQAMTAKLVPERHLMNATSLNTASHSVPNIAGPALGGVLVGVASISAAYFITTGALALAVLMMLLGVPAAFGAVERRQAQSATADLREAWDYLAANPELLKLTAAMLTPFVLGQSFVLLLPLFVEQELGGGATMFGALSASTGVGGVLGAMAVATWGERHQIPYLMLGGVISVGIGAGIYGLFPWPPLTGLALVTAGAGESALFAAYETYLLIRLPDEIRGRVMGLTFTMVAFFPISAIAAGGLADLIGLRALAVVEGVIVLGLAGLAWVTVLREVAREGLPEVST